jgi:rhamnosyltransferase
MDIIGKKIVAVVVTYEPNTNYLANQLERVTSQVAHIIVVDNGSAINLEGWLAARHYPNVNCLPLGDNFGVATAQNAGIDWARRQEADYILILDQDSEPATDMVEKLVEADIKMVRQGYAVAAVGPRYVDIRKNNPPPFIHLRGLKLERSVCAEPNAIVPVDYLISSGSLIPMKTLEIVGPMTDNLFIDYVDIEWGLRAKHFGYQSFGVCDATMHHSIGDHPINMFGRQIPLHSPLRHYYLFRNAIWLYQQSWPSLKWKVADAWRLFLKYGFYSMFAQPRLKHLGMMTLGIWHALRGRTGRLERSLGDR